MANIDTSSKSQPKADIVARFEEARAVLRPLKCDSGKVCWVRDGAAATKGDRVCVGCCCPLNLLGNEHRHAAVLSRLCAEVAS